MCYCVGVMEVVRIVGNYEIVCLVLAVNVVRGATDGVLKLAAVIVNEKD